MRYLFLIDVNALYLYRFSFIDTSSRKQPILLVHALASRTYPLFRELNVNSVIAKPAHAERLFVSTSSLDSGEDTYTIRGFAYAGGGRRVSHVELSLDEGHTWALADVCV